MYSQAEPYPPAPQQRLPMYPQVDSYAQEPPLMTGFPVRSDSSELFYVPKKALKWSTGLCGCGEDLGNCFTTCCCPCITFGRIAEIVDNGSTSCGTSGALYTLVMVLTGCQCLYSCFHRSKMRQQYALEESPCTDCLVHCCCEPCALCQEYRELRGRGFDMTIGWHANMEQRSGGAASVPPPVQGGMSR